MRRNFIRPFVLIVCFAVSCGALAQGVPKWDKVCVNPKSPATCRIVQSLYLSKMVDGVPKSMGRILELTVLYSANEETKKRMLFLNFKVPFGVSLQEGLVFKIDDHKKSQLAYLRCSNGSGGANQGCDASVPIDSALLSTLKAGNRITVGFLPWGESKLTVLQSTLVGFAKVFKGIK